MKKKKKFTSLILVLGLISTMSSCRDSFEEDFPDVEILNNAPELTGQIDTVSLTLGFSESSLDLSAFVVDAESDPLTATAANLDEFIVKVTSNGSFLAFFRNETGKMH